MDEIIERPKLRNALQENFVSFAFMAWAAVVGWGVHSITSELQEIRADMVTQRAVTAIHAERLVRLEGVDDIHQLEITAANKRLDSLQQQIEERRRR